MYVLLHTAKSLIISVVELLSMDLTGEESEYDFW
jgi:hypothetical protein